MKNLATVFVLAAVLPLVGCATPYGYSPGAWAYYDGDYDYGHDGYDRPIAYYSEAEYGWPYGSAYASQPYYGGYYGQPPYLAPPNASSWYSTYYSGCGCGY
jgi:hypothetical protein